MVMNSFRKVDFSALTSLENSLKENKVIDVLNGIAFDPINDRYQNIFIISMKFSFYLTGKLWTHIYQIKLKFKI